MFSNGCSQQLGGLRRLRQRRSGGASREGAAAAGGRAGGPRPGSSPPCQEAWPTPLRLPELPPERPEPAERRAAALPTAPGKMLPRLVLPG